MPQASGKKTLVNWSISGSDADRADGWSRAASRLDYRIAAGGRQTARQHASGGYAALRKTRRGRSLGLRHESASGLSDSPCEAGTGKPF